MQNLFYDIIEALEQYWQAVVGGGIPVSLAFKDERYNTDQDRTYPCALIQLIGNPIDQSRRLACPEIISETDTDEGIAKVKKPPVPINLEFQIDGLSHKQLEAWDIAEKILRVLGQNVRDILTTNAGREFYIMALPDSMDPAQIFTDSGLWRSAYRFYVQAWLTETEFTEVKIVLQQKYDINLSTITVTEES